MRCLWGSGLSISGGIRRYLRELVGGASWDVWLWIRIHITQYEVLLTKFVSLMLVKKGVKGISPAVMWTAQFEKEFPLAR